MEAPDGSPPQSICMIRAAEFFPKSEMEKEDPQLTVPFQELAGESVKYLGRTSDGVMALSNYRISLLKNTTNSETSVPLGLVESMQIRDPFQLVISCKDASTVKCSFETAEQCADWQRRVQSLVGVPDSLESLFAFPFCSWTLDSATTNGFGAIQNGSIIGDCCFIDQPNGFAYPITDERLQRAFRCEDDFMREVERLNFDLNGPWRISHANKDFKLCPSYPRKILVPCCISDDTLINVANFRASRRLPAVVWRHRRSGAVIARSSQPEVGWLGWRNSKDEQLLKALADACAFDRGEQMRQLAQTTSGQTIPSGDSSPSSPDSSHEEVAMDEVRKVLIVDARSYTSAVTNRARGGGCECIEYYPCAEIEFMNLGNIHVIRKSFHALRQLCASPPDIPNWLGLLEKTMWFQHLSGLLTASMTVCHAIEKKGQPVLVHCSDGWDRTPQIVATAQLCLDPFYRTVEGFRVLVEREWLSFGHKFADRCGHGPGSDELNERCPVFLQWLDLVHQIHKQFPCSFEFSMGYLIKLAQHSHSCLFGTFFCNSLKERIDKSVFERTFSVWHFLSGPIYRNPLYVPIKEKVLWPAHNVRDLSLWTEVYLCSLGNQNCIDFPVGNVDGIHGSTTSSMVKTRSYGDFNSAGILQNGISRRSSDPNVTVDPNLTVDSNSENNSIADLRSEREDSPDVTQKLKNLTTDLNHKNHDQGDFKVGQEQCQQEPINKKNEKSEEEYTNTDILPNIWMARQLQQEQNNPPCIKDNVPSLFFSSPQNKKCKDVACAPNNNCFTPILTETVPLASALSSESDTCSTANTQATRFNEILHTLSHFSHDTKVNGCQIDRSSDVDRREELVKDIDGDGVIPTKKTTELNLNMLESVNLGDPCYNVLSPYNGIQQSNYSDSQDNMWHGSVNTSTDTLVPLDAHRQENYALNDNRHLVEMGLYDDTTDGSDVSTKLHDMKDPSMVAETSTTFAKDTQKNIAYNSNTNCSILPKVHGNINGRPNILPTCYNKGSVTSVPTVFMSNSHINQPFSPGSPAVMNNSTNAINILNTASASASANLNPMEESILILPEHQKLQISFSGTCETVVNNIASTTTKTSTPAISLASSTTATLNSYANGAFPVADAQRRRRTSSSNSRPDGLPSKQINGSATISRFSLPGVHSLPMTPPGLPERSQIAFSCPDGLAHALSEENIRLQQVMHDHKIRVDELVREMRDMRIAFLKKSCPNCNNASATNDEQAATFLGITCKCKNCKRPLTRSKVKKQSRHMHETEAANRNVDRVFDVRENDESDCIDQAVDDEMNGNEFGDGASSPSSASSSICRCGFCDVAVCRRGSASVCSALDNVENGSICSWEALEDQSGPSSCASSSIQPNVPSIRWVPDHAVSRCTSCQTEFWLGRRKHHCRSCGQIFCADCSEFTAALPDEKLFSPVRLCGPCYHAVTMRSQVKQMQNSALLQLQQQTAPKYAAANAATATATTATSKT